VEQDDVPDHAQHRDEHRAHDLLVIAQAEQAPAPLVEPEQEEEDERARDHRRVGGVEQLLVARRDSLVESEREGEVPGQCDQHAVHEDLWQRVAMDAQGRGRTPSAHGRRF
jgi:hypothetical protein